MSSQTPITDEIQGYGVLDAAVIESMRTRELSGELTSAEVEPVLIQCREIAVTNADLKLENLSIADNMISIISNDVQQEKKDLYTTIEDAEKTDEQREQDLLLTNLFKN